MRLIVDGKEIKIKKEAKVVWVVDGPEDDPEDSSTITMSLLFDKYTIHRHDNLDDPSWDYENDTDIVDLCS